MNDSYRREALKKEIEILKKIDHPNVIKLYDAVDTGMKVNLIMEYVKGRSLYSYMKKAGGRVNETDAKIIVKQLVDAIAYLHRERIVHRDLKLENLLIDDKKVVKVIDFGFSVSVKPDKKIPFTCGTPHYRAPELA